MGLSEFALIDHFFRPLGANRDDVVIGVGDDAAVLAVAADRQLAVAVDTLVAGVHFPLDTSPGDIGYKCLAVNLSDLAAMGAEPAWATLALTLPAADEAWLAAFAQGWADLARRYNVALVGGDTTRGPLTVSVQVMGFVPGGGAVTRGGARPGDDIYASGTLGDGYGGLRCILDGSRDDEHSRYLRQRLHRPMPRIELGLALRGIATAMIDVSDGLAADLGHIAEQSGCGARIELDQLPVSTALVRLASDFAQRPELPGLEQATAAQVCALVGGDDYELCFTAPPGQAAAIEAQSCRVGCPVTRIGSVVEGAGLSARTAGGEIVPLTASGYRHF